MTKKRYFKLVKAIDAIIRKSNKEYDGLCQKQNQRLYDIKLKRYINENPLFNIDGETFTRKEAMTKCVNILKDIYPINFKGV